MERFTKRAGDTVAYIGPGAQYPGTGDIPAEMTAGEIRAALKRLAAYEDTRYSPADFDRLCREMSDLRMAAGLDTYEDLRKAIKTGCVLVLPCPIGTAVYTHDTVCSGRRSLAINCEYGQNCERNPHIKCPIRVVKRPFTLPMYKNLGKTFWLTEEEAEAAIPASRRHRPR